MSRFVEPEIIPIPLRDGAITVNIHGIPYNLTKSEAEKIANTILALAFTQNEKGE